MRAAAVAALLAFAAVEASPASGEGVAPVIRTFSGWTATCNNLRACVAIGSSDDGDGLFYVRVSRAAAQEAVPETKVVLAATDPLVGAPAEITLVAKGVASPLRIPARKVDAEGTTLAADARDPAVLNALVAAQAVDYSVGSLKGRLALDGLSAALRFVDERQGRVGTSTALVARDAAAAKTVPPTPATPIVQVAGRPITTAALPPLSRRLLDMAAPACDPEVVEAHADAAAWSLGENRLLVAVPCAEGAYNLSVALYTTDAKGEQPRPAMLEQPPHEGDASVDNVVVNYALDTKSATLSSLDKGRGLGDCGSQRSWAWTGEIFALIAANELEACPGALPDDWPSVYVARREDKPH